MKLSVIFELLLILIIVAYGAYGKPLEKNVRVAGRQEPAAAVAVDVDATSAKPAAAEDDDDIDILSLIAGDDGEFSSLEL